VLPFTIPFTYYVCKCVRCPCRPTRQADPSASKKRETLFESNRSNIIVGDIVMDGVGWKGGKREVRKESRRGKAVL
jgi:hypothetical protein